MRIYWEITKREYRRYMTYRAAMMAGLITNLGFGVMRVSVLLALLGDEREVAGFDEAGLITYVALTQAVIAYLSMFGWYELINSVYSGDISSDLLKPAGFMPLWFARDVGRALVNFIMRGLLFLFFFELIYDLRYPTKLTQWLALGLSLILALMISFGWRFLINTSAFWSPQSLSISRFGFIISWFFSGFLMPLRFFPEWVQMIASWTPFPHMLNSIVEIYTGIITGTELVQLLITQAAWAGALILVAQLILRAGTKRLVILGG